ncbi:MAG: hypothetical protein ACXU86_10795 [Archangium sp.]
MTPAEHLEALNPASPESPLPAVSDAAAVDRALDELERAEPVDPTHPELLEQSAPAEVAPAHPELLEPSSRPAAPAQAAPSGSSPPPERSAEAVARLRRRVRQNLRGAQGLEKLRDVMERATLSGLSLSDVEAEVAKVAEEKRKTAGRRREAPQAAEEWERLARAACAQLPAAPAVEEVPTAPQPPPQSEPTPAAPPEEPPVMVMGQPIERVAHFAEPIQWFLKSLAELTKGTAFDLTRRHEGVIFKGTQAEREIQGDPCTRLTELLAVRKAAKVEVTEGEEAEPESPTWELLAYGAAVAIAIGQKQGHLLGKAASLAKRGSIGAARAAARAVKGFGGRRK